MLASAGMASCPGRPGRARSPAFCALARHTEQAQTACIRCTTATSLVPFVRNRRAYSAPTPMPRAKQFSARALEIASASQPFSASPALAIVAPISRHLANETSKKLNE
eukprot:532766-Prymnesium_polylepis.1